MDRYIADIESMRDDGAIVLIKWDGLRPRLRQTIVVTRDDTDYAWRKDCDDIETALGEAIDAYKKAHGA